jgi:hypothetical protein
LGDLQMGVDLIWRDSDGTELDRVSDAPGWFARAIDRVQNPPRTDFPVMRSIDLYGDTSVIPPRTDTLAEELRRSREETVEPEARIHLGKMLTVARAASSKKAAFSNFAAINRSPNSRLQPTQPAARSASVLRSRVRAARLKRRPLDADGKNLEGEVTQPETRRGETAASLRPVWRGEEAAHSYGMLRQPDLR